MPNNKKKGTSQSDPNKKTISGNHENRLDNNFNKIIDYLQARYEIRKNIVEHRLEYRKTNSDSKEYKELIGEDLSCQLQSYTTYTKIASSLTTILGSTLYVTEYNPIKNYFESLPKWSNSDPDYIAQLSSFVTAKNQNWFNSQFKKMIVRNVAATLGYINFNKQCFVLTGGQSAGKSSFIRFLCPTELKKYYTEQIDFFSKDGVIALTQNFLINFEELDKYNGSKNQSGHIKTFMSTEFVKVRLPYGKNTIRQKRIANFLGTTNHPQFLTDPTGNVRWLIMELEHINHDHGGPNGYNAKVNIDLVYAQAYHLLKSSFEYKLTSTEMEQSELYNKSFLVETTESGLVLDYFMPCEEEEATHGLSIGIIMKTLKTQTTLNLRETRVKNALLTEGFLRKNSFYFTHNQQTRKGIYLVKLIDKHLEQILSKCRIVPKE